MFEKIIGHSSQKENFKNIIEKHNVSHAYLFSGDQGIGKALFAKEFAKLLLNCDKLEACPDFKYICKSNEKKDIVVEQIRKDIIDDIYIVPASSEYKVYIIDDANNLNISAQNTLLKTLEEPPKYVVIILIASNINTFLPTILSRVSKITFQSLRKMDVSEYIEKNYNIKLSDNVINYLDGSIGQAIDIIESGAIEKLKKIDELLSILITKDYIKSLLFIQDIDFNNKYILDYLLFVLYENNKYMAVKHVERAKQRLRNNGNYDIVIDTMILKILDNI